MNLKHTTFILLSAALLAGDSALAAPKYGVGIGSPANGSALELTSAWYNIITEEITVGGGASLPPGKFGQFTLAVHGLATPMNPIPGSPGDYSYSTTVSVGPNPPLWSPAGFPSWYPYRAYFTDKNKILLPIVVELIHIPSGAVAARDRVVIYDKRSHPDLETHRVQSGVSSSLAVQITNTGLPGLGPAHASSLPDPDLETFNDVLLTEYPSPQKEVVIPTAFLAPDKACFDLVDQEVLFTELAAGAYNAAVAEAMVWRELYQEAKDLAQQTPTLLDDIATEATFCVKKNPQPEDFEVCVGEVAGNLVSLELRDVEAVDLSEGPGLDQIQADSVILGRLDGLVDGLLGDIFVRWKKGPPTCLVRPRGNVTDDHIVLSEELSAWVACNGLEADAVSADDQDLLFSYDVDPNDQEQIQVLAQSLADFDLGAASLDHNVGTCGQSFFDYMDGVANRNHVADLLEDYYNNIDEALDGAWNDGFAGTQQANSLERLLSPAEHGNQIIFDPSDHYLTSTFQQVTNAGPIDGIRAVLDTDVAVKPGFAVVPTPATWVYPPNGLFRFSTNGLSRFQMPFDISYAVTTGGLNQVLRETSAARLYFDFTPTWDELGLDPADFGLTQQDDPPLNQEVLSAFLPAFEALPEGTLLTIKLRPMLTPITWMPPDGTVEGLLPLTYQMGQFRVEFVEERNGRRDKLWLRAFIDFFAGDLRLKMNGQDGHKFLTPLLAKEFFQFTIVGTRFRKCPMVTVMNFPRFQSACSRGMASALGGLIIPRLEGILVEMLSEYPAPQFFDSEGKATAPAQVQQTHKYQWEQNVVLYGDFLDN